MRAALSSPKARGAGIVVTGIGLVIAFWSLRSIQPQRGLDPSWRAALSMAVEDGFRWGTEVVFTYGPLGYLSQPQLFDSRLGALAWFFELSLRLGFGVTLTWTSFRIESGWRAVALAVLGVFVASMVPVATTVAVAVLAIGFIVAGRPNLPAWGQLALATALGAVGSATLLVKLNDGLAALGVGGLVALALASSRRESIRNVAAWVIGATASLVGLWLLSGQRLDDLAGFLVTGLAIINGYSRAMGVEEPRLAWEYVAAGIVLFLALPAAFRATRHFPSPRRWALLGALVLLEFLAFKHGFARHNGVAGTFFALTLLAVGWAIMPFVGDRPQRGLLLACLLMATLGATRIDPFARLGGISAFADQAATVLDRGRRTELIATARDAARVGYNLPVPMIEAIGSRSVTILPHETAVAWAFPELNWRPLPVFQLYQAYTPSLDGLNAAALHAESGPEFILRHASIAIDSRNPAYEAPETYLAMVCQYRQVVATKLWQLLRRGPNRCGSPEPIGSVVVHPGDLIRVPVDGRQDRIVVVHVDGVEVGLASTLRAVLWKSPIWSAWVTDVGTGRLVPDNAGSPLIIASPPSIGYTDPFRVPAGAPSFKVVTGPSVTTADDPQPAIELTIRFESIEFRPG